MKASNLKVKTCLEQSGIEIQIRILPTAVHTAQLAANALGCDVGQIANSLVFRVLDSDEAILIMCAGDRRVDLTKVRSECGIELGRADAQFVKQIIGFAIGGVPPTGHLQPLQTLLDTSLQRYDQIWAAAGTPDSIFSLYPLQLERITAGRWFNISIEKP